MNNKRVRKTEDEFRIMANYGYGEGWEEVNCETTREDGRRSLKEYRENDKTASYKLVKKRVKIAPVAV